MIPFPETHLTLVPANQDDLAERDKELLASIQRSIEDAEPVKKAREELDRITDQVRRLSDAYFAINTHARSLRDGLVAARDRLDSGLLSHFVNGEVINTKQLCADVFITEIEEKSVSRVIARLTEHDTPLASIAQALAEADLFEKRAAEYERIAKERTAQTLELMRSAVEFESSLSYDTKSTFSGFLGSYGQMLIAQAIAARKNASDTEANLRRLNLQQRR